MGRDINKKDMNGQSHYFQTIIRIDPYTTHFQDGKARATNISLGCKCLQVKNRLA